MTDQQPGGYFWPCPRCQTANPAASPRCRACGAANPYGPPPAQPGPYAVAPSTPRPEGPPFEQDEAAPSSSRGPRLVTAGIVLIVAVIILFVAGQLNQQVNEVRREIDDAVSGVTVAAPWTRSANYTTCDQWASEMTASQRRAMAGELLPVLRWTVDTAATGGTELTGAFVDAISQACRLPEVTAYDEYMITAAATLAFVGAKQFQP